jgi:hypothetical protein
MEQKYERKPDARDADVIISKMVCDSQSDVTVSQTVCGSQSEAMSQSIRRDVTVSQTVCGSQSDGMRHFDSQGMEQKYERRSDPRAPLPNMALPP